MRAAVLRRRSRPRCHVSLPWRSVPSASVRSGGRGMSCRSDGPTTRGGCGAGVWSTAEFDLPASIQSPFIPAHSSPNGERSLAFAGIQFFGHSVPAFAGDERVLPVQPERIGGQGAQRARAYRAGACAMAARASRLVRRWRRGGNVFFPSVTRPKKMSGRNDPALKINGCVRR